MADVSYLFNDQNWYLIAGYFSAHFFLIQRSVDVMVLKLYTSEITSMDDN